MSSSHHIEKAAAKFLQKLIQETEDEPVRLARKLYMICEHMKLSGKENSLPYQVICRAKETVIIQHGINIDALMSSHLPLPGQPQLWVSGLVRSNEKDASDNPFQLGGNDSLLKGQLLGTWQAASSSKNNEDDSKVASCAENEIVKNESVILNRLLGHPSCGDRTHSFEHENPASLSMEDRKSAKSRKSTHGTAKKTDNKKVGGKRKKVDSSSAVEESDNASCNAFNSKKKKIMRRQNTGGNISTGGAETSEINTVQHNGPGFRTKQDTPQTFSLSSRDLWNQAELRLPTETFPDLNSAPEYLSEGKTSIEHLCDPSPQNINKGVTPGVGVKTNIRGIQCSGNQRCEFPTVDTNSICEARKGNSRISAGFSFYSTMKIGFSSQCRFNSSSSDTHGLASTIYIEKSGDASAKKVPEVHSGGISHSAANTCKMGQGRGTLEQKSKADLLGKREMIDTREHKSSAKPNAEVFQKDLSGGTKNDVEIGSNKAAISFKPFKAHHLKQLRAQCLVFLAFKNSLIPRKLDLEIALGDSNLKEDGACKGSEDHRNELSPQEHSNSQEVIGVIGRPNETKETEKDTKDTLLTSNSEGIAPTGSPGETDASYRGPKITEKMKCIMDFASDWSITREGREQCLAVERKPGAEIQTKESIQSLFSVAGGRTLSGRRYKNSFKKGPKQVGKTSQQASFPVPGLTKQVDPAKVTDLLCIDILNEGASKENEPIPANMYNPSKRTQVLFENSRVSKFHRSDVPIAQNALSVKEQTSSTVGKDMNILSTHVGPTDTPIPPASVVVNSLIDADLTAVNGGSDPSMVSNMQKQLPDSFGTISLEAPDISAGRVGEKPLSSGGLLSSPIYLTSERLLMDQRNRKIFEEKSLEMKQHRVEESAARVDKLKEKGPIEQQSRDNFSGKREKMDHKDQESSAKLRVEVFQKGISVDSTSNVGIGSNKMTLSYRPFKEHQLKQLRAQCLVFLAFRDDLVPRKLHLEIALGDSNLKQDGACKGLGHRRHGLSLKEPSNIQEVSVVVGRPNKTKEVEKDTLLSSNQAGAAPTGSFVEIDASKKGPDVTGKLKSKKAFGSDRFITSEEGEHILAVERKPEAAMQTQESMESDFSISGGRTSSKRHTYKNNIQHSPQQVGKRSQRASSHVLGLSKQVDPAKITSLSCIDILNNGGSKENKPIPAKVYNSFKQSQVLIENSGLSGFYQFDIPIAQNAASVEVQTSTTVGRDMSILSTHLGPTDSKIPSECMVLNSLSDADLTAVYDGVSNMQKQLTDCFKTISFEAPEISAGQEGEKSVFSGGLLSSPVYNTSEKLAMDHHNRKILEEERWEMKQCKAQEEVSALFDKLKEKGTLDQQRKDNLLGKREMIDLRDWESSPKLQAVVFQKDISVDSESDVVTGSNKMALSSWSFKGHQLKQLRAQCLVFLAFRNDLVPRKSYLDIALGDSSHREDGACKGLGDLRNDLSLKQPGDSQEIIDAFERPNETKETEKKTLFTRSPTGSSPMGGPVETDASFKGLDISKKMKNKKACAFELSITREEREQILAVKRKPEAAMQSQGSVFSMNCGRTLSERHAYMNNFKHEPQHVVKTSQQAFSPVSGISKQVEPAKVASLSCIDILKNGASKENEPTPAKMHGCFKQSQVPNESSKVIKLYTSDIPIAQSDALSVKVQTSGTKGRGMDIVSSCVGPTKSQISSTSMVSNSLTDANSTAVYGGSDPPRVRHMQKHLTDCRRTITCEALDRSVGSERENSVFSGGSLSSSMYTTSEKLIMDQHDRKILEEKSWEMKQRKAEERIAACFIKLKENVSTSEDISGRTRSVIELKKLQLLHLQHRLRSDFLHDFFKPITSDIEHLKSIKKHRHGRRIKQLEKFEKEMKEERLNKIRERQESFSEIEAHKAKI